MTPAEIRTVAAGIRVLVLDVDGVLTDGRLQYDADGRECKAFHVRDGLGIQQALGAGIAVAVISGRRSGAAAARLAELRVPHVFLGRNDKQVALAELLAMLNVPADSVACVGDDLPDLEMMAGVGLRIAVADAHPDVVRQAHWTTSLAGGLGAVREVCDLLVAARQAG